jgi:hypothetical protein
VIGKAARLGRDPENLNFDISGEDKMQLEMWSISTDWVA